MPKKKKGGSAKRKKSGKKKAPVEEKPQLAWPWTQVTKPWGAGNPITYASWTRTLRSQYVECDGIVMTPQDWHNMLQTYKYPFDDKYAEAMVQLLITLLIDEGDRKTQADDALLFGAAIRHRHRESHFVKMYGELKEFFAKLDDPTTLDVVIQCFNPDNFGKETHVSRRDLETLIETQLLVTLGLPNIDEIEIPEEKEEKPFEPARFEPLALYLLDNRLRLTDFFFALDKNKDGYLSHEEVRVGVKARIDMDDETLDMLIQDLDADGDGKVLYQELSKSRFKCLVTRRFMIKSLEEKDVVEEADKPAADVEVLRMGLKDFAVLVLHCHYVTRP